MGIWFNSNFCKFTLSAKVVLCNSVTLDMSSSFFTNDVFIIMANDYVSSRLGYCNLLFRSLSKFSLCKLQCIKNNAAKINMSRYTNINPVLQKFHWLPVEHYSMFKTATLVYKFLYTGFPKYFALYLFPTILIAVPVTAWW